MSNVSSADRIHELLPWYVAGTLDSAEQEAFRKHLTGCGPCRDEIAVLESLKEQVERHGEDFFRDHPPADQLVAAVRGDLPGGPGSAEAATVRRHLALCATCAREARWITGDAVAAGRDGRRKAGRSRGWVWALAAAAVVFTLMLPWTLDGRSTSIPPSYFISAPERSGAEAPVYRVDDGDPVIALMFEIDLPDSSFPATFAIRDAAGKTVSRSTEIRRDRLAGGVYLMASCDRKDYPDGLYVGVIQPAPGSGSRDIEIPFRLESD